MEVKREIMKKETDENKRKVSSARFLGLFAAALMTAMLLVAVSVAPVSATDGDNNVPSIQVSICSCAGFSAPRGIAVEADGSLTVTDRGHEAVMRVDQVRGNCTIVSDDIIGTGPSFKGPVGIAVEGNGTLVVADRGLKAVVRVDPVSGNRTVVSDNSTGSGPDFSTPFGIAVEANGSFVVADDDLEAVVRVDPVTGDRTIVSDAIPS